MERESGYGDGHLSAQVGFRRPFTSVSDDFSVQKTNNDASKCKYAATNRNYGYDDYIDYSESQISCGYWDRSKSMCKQREQKENRPASSTQSDAGQNKLVKRRYRKPNPVWTHFHVMDGVAKCRRCSYSTKSVFSTNLKVHLKSHHTLQFNEVIRAEYNLNRDGTSEKPVITGANVLPTGRRHNQVTKHLSHTDSVAPETRPSTFRNIGRCEQSSSPPHVYDRSCKRGRSRRHPVWQYFVDLDAENVGCNMCRFNTMTGNTTNLKKHLRAYHKNEFVHVMELECQQRKEAGCVDSATDGCKGRRKTAEEIARMLDEYKEKNMMDLADDDSPSALSEPIDDGILLGWNLSNQEGESASPIPESDLEASDSPIQPDEQCQFRDFMTGLMDQLSNSSPSIVKAVRDLALGRAINELGTHNVAFFTSTAFQQLMIAMDPNYQCPTDESELKLLAKSARSTEGDRNLSDGGSTSTAFWNS